MSQKKMTQEYNVNWLSYVLKVSTLITKKSKKQFNTKQTFHNILPNELLYFITKPEAKLHSLYEKPNTKVKHRMSNRNSHDSHDASPQYFGLEISRY